MKRRVELHIEELVLHGIDARDRHRVADAVARELGQLLEGAPLPSALTRPTAIPSIDAGSFEAPTRARDTHALGVGIGRAVYGGLAR